MTCCHWSECWHFWIEKPFFWRYIKSETLTSRIQNMSDYIALVFFSLSLSGYQTLYCIAFFCDFKLLFISKTMLIGLNMRIFQTNQNTGFRALNVVRMTWKYVRILFNKRKMIPTHTWEFVIFSKFNPLKQPYHAHCPNYRFQSSVFSCVDFYLHFNWNFMFENILMIKT